MKLASHFSTPAAAHTRTASTPQKPDSETSKDAFISSRDDGEIGPDDMVGLRMLAGGMAGAVGGLGTLGVASIKGVHPFAAAVLGLAVGGAAMVAAREGVDRMMEQS